MSNLKYAVVEEEMVTSTVDTLAKEKHPKPFVVSHGSQRSADTITRRVQEALDFELAQGRMPA